MCSDWEPTTVIRNWDKRMAWTKLRNRKGEKLCQPVWKAHAAYCVRSQNTPTHTKTGIRIIMSDRYSTVVSPTAVHPRHFHRPAPAFTHRHPSCWLLTDRKSCVRGQSVAAAPAVPAAVGVSRRRFAVLRPPAEDLVRAVVTAAAGHARRSLVDLEPKRVERAREGG